MSARNALAFPLDFSSNSTKSDLSRGFLLFQRINSQIDNIEWRLHQYPSLREVIENAIHKSWETYKATEFVELSVAHQHLLLLLRSVKNDLRKIEDEYLLLEDGIRTLIAVYKFYLQHCLVSEPLSSEERQNGFIEVANLDMQLYLYRNGRPLERIKR